MKSSQITKEEKEKIKHKCKWSWGASGFGAWPWCETGEHWWKTGTKLTGDKTNL